MFVPIFKNSHLPLEFSGSATGSIIIKTFNISNPQIKPEIQKQFSLISQASWFFVNFLLYPKITVGIKLRKTKNIHLISEHLEKIIFSVVPHPEQFLHTKSDKGASTKNICHAYWIFTIKGVRGLID